MGVDRPEHRPLVLVALPACLFDGLRLRRRPHPSLRDRLRRRSGPVRMGGTLRAHVWLVRQPVLAVCLFRLASPLPYSREGARSWLIALGLAVAFALPSLWPGDIDLWDDHDFLGESTALVGVGVWLLSFLPPLFALAVAARQAPTSGSPEYAAAVARHQKPRGRVLSDTLLRP